MTGHPIDVLIGEEARTLPISDELEAELARLTPVRLRSPHRHLATVLALSAAYVLLALAVMTLRRDLDELPALWVIGVAAAWVLGCSLALWFSLAPRRDSMLTRWRAAAVVAVVAAVGFVVLGLVLHPHGPSSAHYGWERFAHGHACLEIGLGIALLPVVAGTVLLRRSQYVRTRWIAAALGGGGGCLGGLFLHFYCRIADGPHVGLIHGGVVGVAMLLASVLASRFLEAR